MQDYAEIVCAVAACFLASVAFQANHKDPKKVHYRENLFTVVGNFLLQEWHAFALLGSPALLDGHFDSEEALSQLDHGSDNYPEPTVYPPRTQHSMVDNHFSFAGSTWSDVDESKPEYDELDHMFMVDRQRGEVVATQFQSTATDHFSFAATGLDDEDADLNEFDHFNYGRSGETLEKHSTQPRSTTNDHFSFAATAFDDDEDNVNEFDHFDYGRPEEVVRKQITTKPWSTITDHFSFAASSCDDDEDDINEFDHFGYGRPEVVQKSSRMGWLHSMTKDHFSFAGSVVDQEEETDLKNDGIEFDHFSYSEVGSEVGEASHESTAPSKSTAIDHFSFSGSAY